MSTVKAEVLLSTCNDDRYPASNIVDGKPSTFFVSTGCFPQEIILGVKAGRAAISRIVLVSSGVRKLRVEKCVDETPQNFETIVECELQAKEPGEKQQEQFQLNRSTAGNNVRYVKLVVLSGYDEFVGIYDFSLEGQEL